MANRRNEGSREAYYGINAKALAKDAGIKLSKIRAKIDKLQEPWAEVDPMIESATKRTLDSIDELLAQYNESAQYMMEPMGE